MFGKIIGFNDSEVLIIGPASSRGGVEGRISVSTAVAGFYL